ncbi:MAG: polyprenyl synthetase family protein [Armatimonadota bacterium]|nr:polyprenyl synthetase family protein [Armatimonadota bacterium]MDW8291349.1 polyprenyl synthetase family protein [Armatimonadota bacterium]
MSVTTTFVKYASDPQVAKVLDLILPDLLAVEERIQREISSSVRTIWSLGEHVLSSGGKRLRPALVCLSAHATGVPFDRQRLVPLAAAAELMHTATLIHDDVVDNTTTRRGRPTASALFGNGVTVLTGDYLLAKVMSLLAEDGDIEIIRTVSRVAVEMSEGEVLQMLHTGDLSISEETYFDIIRKKTAVFIQGCCRTGALAARAPQPMVEALSQYGFHIGMAFQLADDLLDYIGNPARMGKPVGSDLREGKFTLPLIIALRESTPADRERLLQLVETPAKDGEIQKVVEIIRRYEGFARTQDIAAQHARQAKEALSVLPPSAARSALAALCDYIVEREE